MFKIITIIWSLIPTLWLSLKFPNYYYIGEFVGSGFHLGNLYIH
jgi:hypothetical protein